ncbi:MAG: endo alpha-1,4 polygalactosaminidase [Alphaproteobacteria bacterium]|nr:endo alpha-1,4 polygalactosaminidase [Alphaproteobacteria bacterium]
MWWLILISCDSACPEGQIREPDGCVDYTPTDPVPAEGVWQPAPGTAWQWQLQGAVDTSLDVEMVDIDLVDPPDATFEALQADGRVVTCYFSAGTWEDWRDDVGDVPPEAIGDRLPEWEGESWWDVRHPAVREVLEGRLDLAVARGCDAVEPDNVDGYDNRNGLALTATEQLAFNRWIADEAHTRGLSVGLKNDLGQLDALEPWFDWALNEECVAFNECDVYQTFLSQEKAVFHVEYVDDWADAPALAEEVCGAAPGLDTLIKLWDLTPERLACED